MPSLPVPNEYARTDSGNALLMSALFGEDIRWDHRRGRWLLWRGNAWRTDATAEIVRRAQEAAQHRRRYAHLIQNREDEEDQHKWSFQSEDRHRIESAIALLKSTPPVADDGSDWDTDPWLLGVPNGVVDLHTGELRPGRREDRITLCAGPSFDPAATCPRWERFLQEIFSGDEDLIRFMQRSIGYCLTGSTTENCIYVLYGEGRNGKSTLITQIRTLLGDYACNTAVSTLEENSKNSIPSDLAALVGKRFVTASETSNAMHMNAARVKALTGGDEITARFLHHDFFSFRPACKIFLATNHKPVITDSGDAFWQRMRLVPFNVQFLEAAADHHLEATLFSEQPGILAWAVRGCLDWQAEQRRSGYLVSPPSVARATTEYEEESNPISEFISESCLIGRDEYRAPAGPLYVHYCNWCDLRHISRQDRLTQRAFGDLVTKKFPKHKTSTGTLYKGIRLSTLPKKESST